VRWIVKSGLVRVAVVVPVLVRVPVLVSVAMSMGMSMVVRMTVRMIVTMFVTVLMTLRVIGVSMLVRLFVFVAMGMSVIVFVLVMLTVLVLPFVFVFVRHFPILDYVNLTFSAFFTFLSYHVLFLQGVKVGPTSDVSFRTGDSGIRPSHLVALDEFCLPVCYLSGIITIHSPVSIITCSFDFIAQGQAADPIGFEVDDTTK
jgi:hypothetical protein